MALARLGANLGAFPDSVFLFVKFSELLVEGLTSEVTVELDGTGFT